MKRLPKTAVVIVFFMFLHSDAVPVIAQEVRSKQGMVVSANRVASEIGVSVLREGGNAVDAAVAVGFALAVAFPEAGNIGGGGFLLYRMAEGDVVCLDFREKAPIISRHDMYLDSAGNITRDIVRGHKSAAVPGTVAGLIKALAKYGKLDIKTVIQPSIDLAYGGFEVDRNLEGNLRQYEEDFREHESTLKIFTQNGSLYREGDILRLPDLAATLERIRDTDGRDFYTGKTADLIIAEMERGDGFITREDLADYRVIERSPVKGTYRDYEIFSVPPPSSGGVSLIGILNILEGYDLRSMGFHSSEAVHIMSEAMKFIGADRAYYLGDPDFNTIPVRMLISKEYAAQRRTKIDPHTALRSVEISPEIPIDSQQNTTHYSVIDKDGNCVAVTYTINDLFGSQVIVEGAGFFLNNEMDDFSSKSGIPNSYGLIGGIANSIEPNKRPLSSMTPTIIVKNNKPVLILGSRGGSRIITSVAQVIINVVDFGMNIQKAVDMPRFHHQWLPEEIVGEQYCFPEDVVRNLALRGHNFKVTNSSCGKVQAIYFDQETGWIYGGADLREGGVAVGY